MLSVAVGASAVGCAVSRARPPSPGARRAEAWCGTPYPSWAYFLKWDELEARGDRGFSRAVGGRIVQQRGVVDLLVSPREGHNL